MNYIVGLTGGIGSGKSTIAEMFQQLGVPVVDADIVAREVVAKGSPLLKQIVEKFGKQVLLQNGELDRSKLRQIIFNHQQNTQWLNNLLHPAIRKEMLRQLNQTQAPYVLWVVPLLIESNLIQYCDRILVIDVLPEIQIERATKRDKNKIEMIKNIMKAQVSREERLSYAQDVIENNLELSENSQNLEQQVSQLHQQYLLLAQ
ncbi:dephospho-CoA kinase [Pasteurella atlantica]|uniref:dephospho-CoA kinase n=1 Tax=Pasteurellaceae TaxID=712 RepID=UPI00277552F4|nr:dephospho-CoA kinase [Pasteurella atlantica]MDP8033498.1 dephospho-CoA kinase [Pasteurella atlantica]MDP8035434.1 dephospho-CoA kinase [Pasteurella atlantica]MDP8037385.1 dephospho-CoA kinase [Pasteurella atlantica]MDP8047733.1 dephospho-CoA kinase [Pasteurella atlantica]MDP8049706.1 dephospho-CoA kinase [Pasteurella atlantica]